LIKAAKSLKNTLPTSLPNKDNNKKREDSSPPYDQDSSDNNLDYQIAIPKTINFKNIKEQTENTDIQNEQPQMVNIYKRKKTFKFNTIFPIDDA
jgi:hypothetical protein